MKYLKYYDSLATAVGDDVASPGAIYIKDVHSAAKFTGTLNETMYVNSKGFFTDGSTPDPYTPEGGGDKGGGYDDELRETSSSLALTYMANEKLDEEKAGIFTTYGKPDEGTIVSHDFTKGIGTIIFKLPEDKKYYYVPTNAFPDATYIDLPLCFGSIETNAFDEGLIEVHIPESIINVSETAFSLAAPTLLKVYWDAIGDVDDETYPWAELASSFEGFWINCELITEFHLGCHVRRLFPYCCAHLRGISEILYPYSLRTIENHAFYECAGLAKITPTEKLNWICGTDMPTDYEVAIYPNYSLTYRGAYIFAECSSLKNVTFWNKTTFTTITYMFENDSAFANIYLYVLLADNTDAPTWPYSKSATPTVLGIDEPSSVEVVACNEKANDFLLTWSDAGFATVLNTGEIYITGGSSN